MVDFSLSLTEPLGGLIPAEEKFHLRATNRESFSQYGLMLTPDDCEMLVQTVQTSMRENDLVAVGESITPRLIHWFLQSSYFGRQYAQEVAELTELFYRTKAELQTMCEENHRTDCMLSDNAILFYMYRFYICTSCSGDIDAVAEKISEIIIPAMTRLLHLREKLDEARLQKIAQSGDAEMRALYADRFAENSELTDLEIREDRERRDRLFRSFVSQHDPNGYHSRITDYDPRYDSGFYDPEEDLYAAYDGEAPVFGSFAEEMDEMLMYNPELLLPSEEFEMQWEEMAEEWARLDAATADLYQ